MVELACIEKIGPSERLVFPRQFEAVAALPTRDGQDAEQGEGRHPDGQAGDDRRRGGHHADGGQPRSRGGLARLQGQRAAQAEPRDVQDSGRSQELEK